MTNQQAQHLLEHLSDISDSLKKISNSLGSIDLEISNGFHDVQQRLESLCTIQESEHAI